MPGPSLPETLDDWLRWQSGLNPNRMDLGLERVRSVWDRLHGALTCAVITVGGTNGKGSCVALIEAMASAGGYQVGAYSSPHLLHYNERVRINGQPVSDDALCDAFARIEAARGEVRLTYFEFGTLAALILFQDAGLDLVVLEVGLGGRLDAVNLIDADVAVVTSVGHDHQEWLGDTLASIAIEKAGIFRSGRPAVIGQPDAPPELREAALGLGALVLQVGHELACEPQDGGWTWTGADGERLALPTPAMRGLFQYHNAAAAVAALRSLKARLPLAAADLRAGLMRASLPGRFQVIAGSVTWILDVAHNREAAQALSANLGAFRCAGQLRAVFGVLADKDPVAIVSALGSRVDAWYLTESDDPRALAAGDLAARLAGHVAQPQVIPNLSEALDLALAESAPGDCILVLGSFTIVGAALARQGDGRSAP